MTAAQNKFLTLADKIQGERGCTFVEAVNLIKQQNPKVLEEAYPPLKSEPEVALANSADYQNQKVFCLIGPIVPIPIR